MKRSSYLVRLQIQPSFSPRPYASRVVGGSWLRHKPIRRFFYYPDPSTIHAWHVTTRARKKTALAPLYYLLGSLVPPLFLPSYYCVSYIYQTFWVCFHVGWVGCQEKPASQSPPLFFPFFFNTASSIKKKMGSRLMLSSCAIQMRIDWMPPQKEDLERESIQWPVDRTALSGF